LLEHPRHRSQHRPARDFRYYYSGQRVAKIAGSSVTRYYGELAEVTDGTLTKHYFAAGMRIASFSEPASGALAALSEPPLVQFARSYLSAPAVVVLVRDDAAKVFSTVAALIFFTLIVLPPSRRRRVKGRRPVRSLMIMRASATPCAPRRGRRRRARARTARGG
jgi:hypothetical protein